MNKLNLIKKLETKLSVIGVIGLGYVGLPLALKFSEKNFNVIGIDTDPSKVKTLQKGESYIKHIPREKIFNAVKNNGNFVASNDFNLLKEADAIILCLPTPLTKNKDPDLSYIKSTLESLQSCLRPGQVISLESTTYPGTSEEIVLPYLKLSKLSVGEDIFLVYSPEREDPGNKSYNTSTIPKICSGYSKACLEVGVHLYKQIVSQVVEVSSLKTAEMTKLLENIHRAVNIGLVNEMKIVANKMGINIYEVIDAASTKPFGFTPFYPGPGLGGHCIPIDPFYLTWKAKEFGLHTKFIELAGEVNTAMPNWVVEKATDALNYHNKSIKGSNILIVGLSYKQDIGDTRESPSIEIMNILGHKGAKIYYSDSYVPNFPKMRRYKFDLSSSTINQDLLDKMDCVIIATAHSNIDYELIKANSKLIIDTRGVYKESAENIIQS